MKVVNVLANVTAGIFAQRIDEFKGREYALSVYLWAILNRRKLCLIHAKFENPCQEQRYKTGQEVGFYVGFQRDINRAGFEIGLGDLKGLLDFP